MGHLIATSVFFTLFSSLFLTTEILGLIKIGLRDAALRPDIVTPLVLVFGLSACAWALCFIVFSLGRLHLKTTKTVSLKPARGSIITETLIVLPVFFLLTFGLAQMATNSIAGLLTTLATYEAARTASVWGVEVGINRSGTMTDYQTANRKVRLAAAAIIAPATPELASGLAGCDIDAPELKKMRDGMVAAGFSPVPIPEPSVWDMTEAWGKSTFAVRGPTKLTLAYCNTEVSWDPAINLGPQDVNRTEFTTTVRYYHPAVFPLVGPIFQNSSGGNWATDYVSMMTRSYKMHSYLTPNDELP
jgi:hypothetical protein